jgi:hypothetical protein
MGAAVFVSQLKCGQTAASTLPQQPQTRAKARQKFTNFRVTIFYLAGLLTHA